jgi:ABC-type multidrug transport system ATPase subunit
MLQVQNLEKQFEGFHALKGLSFQVNQGDIYGFLGPNGAGKSSSIRIILGLVKADSGTITIDKDIVTFGESGYLRKIGALIERPDFYENLSAEDNLKLMARLYGFSKPAYRIQEVLSLVNLSDRAKDKVKAFSLGMKQRLGIAQAILHKPPLVILDEPSNGLDPEGQKDMLKIISAINSEMKATILFSSHLLHEVEQIANRMAIIHDGKSILEGSVQELLAGQASSYFIGTEKPEKLIAYLNQRNRVISQSPEGITVNYGRAEIPSLMQDLVNHQIEVSEIKEMRSLEQLFLTQITLKK